MSHNLESLLIRPDLTFREAMVRLNENQQGIVLVVDDVGRLLDTVTDGDLRRAFLSGLDLNTPVSVLAELKANGLPFPKPVTVLEEAPDHEVQGLMAANQLRHLPVVDADNRVVDVRVARATASDREPFPLSAMVMAGGRGVRLRPLTDTVPKPLLPIHGKPIMEHTIERLEAAGVRNVVVSTHYMADAFRAHFGDGSSLGVKMDYVEEKQPLGTAGALRLMEPPTGPVLVINGDVLTEINYGAMLAFHQENDAAMTVAVAEYEVQIPYGVVELAGVRVLEITEKPTIKQFINAGVYLLEPEVVGLIPTEGQFNMTDLIDALLRDGRNVVSFPISEYWIDIGQHGDYAKAQGTASPDGANGS
jgi:dTDP-glucose pyrophosphorylase